MRKCKICNETKPLEDFPKRGHLRRHKCKPCYSEYISGYVDNNKDGYRVYYLPEEHYVGMTGKHMGHRLYNHKKKGRITEGCEILAIFERAVDALWFEVMLHQRGYHGCRKF